MRRLAGVAVSGSVPRLYLGVVALAFILLATVALSVRAYGINATFFTQALLAQTGLPALAVAIAPLTETATRRAFLIGFACAPLAAFGIARLSEYQFQKSLADVTLGGTPLPGLTLVGAFTLLVIALALLGVLVRTVRRYTPRRPLVLASLLGAVLGAFVVPFVISLVYLSVAGDDVCC